MKISKEVKEVILNVPENINTIAMFSSFFNIYDSEYYDAENGKVIPVMAISSKEKPRWEKLTYNLFAKGAYVITPGKSRYLKYTVVSENHVNGFVVLERTNEKINGVPVFKVSMKEPEAILVGVWIKYNNNINDDLKINGIINAVDYEGGFIVDDDKFYLGLVIPRNKVVIIDYTISSKDERFRWVWWWDENETSLEFKLRFKEYRYEDLKPDEII